MNNKVKLAIGIAIGILLALLLWNWKLSFVLGAGCILIWLLTRRPDKLLSCFLASSLCVIPVLADDYYAGYNGANCYCFEPADIGPSPEQHAFTLDFVLEADDLGEISPRIVSMRHPAELVDFDTFNASLVPWGIDLNQGAQYSKNGQPVTVTETPFTFNDWTAPLILYPDRQQHQVVIEQASELGNWQRVTSLSIPVGVQVHYLDSPEGPQTFYRVRLEQPVPFRPAGPIVLGCGIGLLVGGAVVCVLTVRACAKNKKKFENMLPPHPTNDVSQIRL